MKILFATSEALPFVSSGGLADVSGSLPKAINTNNKSDIRVVLPYYQCIKNLWQDKTTFITSFTVTLAWRRLYCGVFSICHNGITYYFLDNEYYFKRTCVYGEFDDAERFAFFSKAILDLMNAIDFFPDVLHANDWQTALSIIYLKKIYINDPRYSNIFSVFTIHNIMYQGRYGKEIFEDITGLPSHAYSDILLDGDVNFMKGAIQTADKVTTVSPSYRDELIRGEASYRMEFILNLRQNEFLGIINGIDIDMYSPSRDIYYPYDENFEIYKSENKKGLRNDLSLEDNANIPVFSIISRLCEQKGMSILKPALERFMENNVQLVVLGSGEYMDEEFFKYLEKRYPDKVRTRICFDKPLSKKIYAASDFFIMPSLTEPCGVAQMIACRYGSIPIVRETGGLKDTIKCYTPYDKETTCGFSFYDYTENTLYDTLLRALSLYYDREEFTALGERAMKKDFSWNKSAKKYIEVYNREI